MWQMYATIVLNNSSALKMYILTSSQTDLFIYYKYCIN